MLRGFYTAATGMMAQQRRTEMLTNNIANSTTPGYKADQSSIRSFPDMLLSRIEKDARTTSNQTSSIQIGSLNTGVYLQETTPSFLQGDVKQTGNSSDIAIVDASDGGKTSHFFTVQGSNGSNQYTRDGNFTLDSQGYLTTMEGLYVLSTNKQPIQLNSDDFIVSNNGTVQENGQNVAQLAISYTNTPERDLVKAQNGMFNTASGTDLTITPAAQGYTLQQGFTENSNVDATQSMTDLMTAYRTFEANQKVLQTYDKSMDKAVNEIGKVNG